MELTEMIRAFVLVWCLYFDIIGVKSSATAPHLYFQLSVH